ncbi:hypothetical protein SORBI_3008G069700 [Sorghum bicolor]|uniref:Uncharacterized protein n=1 Tax=Sorghum bicolor TaxID=4558 RepID=A0A1B6PBX4_SORBI|nr:hypothetical protein SORBI_3008G069700 [Sorghum bicolor]
MPELYGGVQLRLYDSKCAGDPAFCKEFLKFTQRVRVVQLSNFKDDSSPIGLAAGTGLTMVVRIKEDQVVCGQPSG